MGFCRGVYVQGVFVLIPSYIEVFIQESMIFGNLQLLLADRV